MMERLSNFINGQYAAPAEGKYLDKISPITGEKIYELPDSSELDVVQAIKAAQKAFDDWSETKATDRAAIMNRIADLIDQKAAQLAEAETRDVGKTLELSKTLDMPRAALNFRFFASAILHKQEIATDMDGEAINYVLRQPVGVAGLISPWNLPLYLLSWKIAPAIACGNTVVCKPSELTPMTAYLLCEICREAGLPNGVLNIVHGTGPNVGAPITAHPKVNTISFTGGTVTGRKVAETCAPLFKKVSLELGGKNPNIIFADADQEAAIAGSLRSSFANQGQVCLCGSRVFVERPAYDEFVNRFIEKASQLRVGDPLETGTDQ